MNDFLGQSPSKPYNYGSAGRLVGVMNVIMDLKKLFCARKMDLYIFSNLYSQYFIK